MKQGDGDREASASAREFRKVTEVEESKQADK